MYNAITNYTGGITSVESGSVRKINIIAAKQLLIPGVVSSDHLATAGRVSSLQLDIIHGDVTT